MFKPKTLKRCFFEISGIIFVVSLIFVFFLRYNIEERNKRFFKDLRIEISEDSKFETRLFNPPSVFDLNIGDIAWVSNIVVLTSGVFVDLDTPIYAHKTNEHSFMITKSNMGYIIDTRYYDGSKIIIIAQNGDCNPSSTRWTKLHDFIWTM